MSIIQSVYLDIDKIACHVDELCERHGQEVIYEAFSILLFSILESPKIFIKLLKIDIYLTEQEIIFFCNLYLEYLFILVFEEKKSGSGVKFVRPQDFLSFPEDTLILLKWTEKN